MMGRRPNALVVEFFERGAKVSGNSNRYEHTCKRCGTLFPKGRVEGLINHLLRKCPRVTDQDRQLVFQRISTPFVQEQPAETQPAGTQPAVTQMPLVLRHEDLPEVSLPAYQQHEQSALDTLAEVSRRHLDYSSNTTPATSGDDGRGKTLSEILAEQVLITELSNYDPTSQQSSTTQDDHLATAPTFDASPLVQAATAASQQLELAQAAQSIDDNQHDLPLDPQLNGNREGLQFLEGINDFSENVDCEATMTWIPTIVKKLKDPPKVPSGAPTPGFGLLQIPMRTGQKRKRFDVDRRKEVSDLRKQGACIRCRMLKKPCSGEDPCSTCQTVHSARLWKVKCLRTRVADEFTLWSMNLFRMRTDKAVTAVIEGATKPATTGRVEVVFSAASRDSFNFPAKSYESASRVEELSELILLNDGDAASDRLEQYSDRIIKVSLQHESSAFMKATIKQAQVLIDAEEPKKVADDAKSKRSCYNLQEKLLSNVLELWALTKLLTSTSDATWTLHFIPTAGQQMGAEGSEAHEDAQSTEAVLIANTSPSHSLIVSQLQANVESRCSKLSKIVMNELERRLLQRQQASPFATFLSAVILLSCVERMAALFRSFDSDDVADELLQNDSQTAQGDKASHSSLGAMLSSAMLSNDDLSFTQPKSPSWPLEQPPSAYRAQCQNFAELLAMLLRMRALPPKTYHTPLGTLSANPDFSPPSRINGRIVKEYVEPHTRAAQLWLGPLKLNVAELVDQRYRATPSKKDGIEAWDMRFVAMLLLPGDLANTQIG